MHWKDGVTVQDRRRMGWKRGKCIQQGTYKVKQNPGDEVTLLCCTYRGGERAYYGWFSCCGSRSDVMVDSLSQICTGVFRLYGTDTAIRNLIFLRPAAWTWCLQVIQSERANTLLSLYSSLSALNTLSCVLSWVFSLWVCAAFLHIHLTQHNTVLWWGITKIFKSH